MPRRLGIDAHDAEVPEKPGPDLPQTSTCGRGNGEHGISHPRQLANRLEFGVEVGDAFGLVREHQRWQPQCEWVVVGSSRAAVWCSRRLPMLGERHALLLQL